jgi:hypothetical protein
VTDVPDYLTLRRHRDLEDFGRRGVWFRRGILGLIALVSLLGLANAFGQRAVTARADVPAATLSISAPRAIRGGDFMRRASTSPRGRP